MNPLASTYWISTVVERMSDQPCRVRQDAGTIRSRVRLWEQEILFIILKVINHRVLFVEGLHSMTQLFFVGRILPISRFLHNLTDRFWSPSETAVELMQVILVVKFIPTAKA